MLKQRKPGTRTIVALIVDVDIQRYYKMGELKTITLNNGLNT